MNIKILKNNYLDKKIEIKKRLAEFKKTNADDYFKELTFCLLTPQSNAKKCWKAVIEINKLDDWEKQNLAGVLKKYTRFHNNKAGYVIDARNKWGDIKKYLTDKNTISLRNLLSENVRGLGLKEASHFLRNIGKSNNEVAILDRHILRNLKLLNIINEDKIKNNKHYFEIEQKFLSFSDKIGIPIDELDLLFWSKENGEIFK